MTEEPTSLLPLSGGLSSPQASSDSLTSYTNLFDAIQQLRGYVKSLFPWSFLVDVGIGGTNVRIVVSYKDATGTCRTITWQKRWADISDDFDNFKPFIEIVQQRLAHHPA